jgi:hypothetical protein
MHRIDCEKCNASVMRVVNALEIGGAEMMSESDQAC